jgi:hypothetical protein
MVLKKRAVKKVTCYQCKLLKPFDGTKTETQLISMHVNSNQDCVGETFHQTYFQKRKRYCIDCCKKNLFEYDQRMKLISAIKDDDILYPRI